MINLIFLFFLLHNHTPYPNERDYQPFLMIRDLKIDESPNPPPEKYVLLISGLGSDCYKCREGWQATLFKEIYNGTYNDSYKYLYWGIFRVKDPEVRWRCMRILCDIIRCPICAGNTFCWMCLRDERDWRQKGRNDCNEGFLNKKHNLLLGTGRLKDMESLRKILYKIRSAKFNGSNDNKCINCNGSGWCYRFKGKDIRCSTCGVYQVFHYDGGPNFATGKTIWDGSENKLSVCLKCKGE
jgi:hypothetical protein